MAVMGTFSQFTTARLALYASQASLSVTGNNIANINTTGYTRQRMDLVSLYSTGQGKYANIFNTNVGYGVLTNGVSRLRDPYLDIRYRNQNSKVGAAEEKADGLYQIGNILDEVNTGEDGIGIIENQFGVFFSALEDLDTNFGSEEYDDLVRAAATTLAAYFRKASADLEDIKVNKVDELNDSIKTINSLLTNIRDLNSQIRTQGIYGDLAPELRDARDLAIDELSSYIPITVTYSMERIDQWTEVEKLTITIKDSQGPDGKPIKLVDGIYGCQITMPDRMPVVNEDYDAQAVIDARQAAADMLKGIKGNAQVPPGRDSSLNGDYDNPVLKTAWAMVKDSQAAKDSIAAAVARLDHTPPTDDELLEIQEKVFTPLMEGALTQAAEDSQAAAGNAKYVLYKVDANQELDLGADGKPQIDSYTNDIEAATTYPQGIYNYDEKDKINENALYMLRVEQLVDQRGRVMVDKDDPSNKSQIIALDDVTFCVKNTNGMVDETRVDSNALGSIQAIREMLTRKGEYSSADEIDRDHYATNKRGIRYYELALDSLAQKFADVFNQMNQMPLETIYGIPEDPANPGTIDLTQEIKDANGNTLKDADGNPLTWGDVLEEVDLLDSNLEPVPVLDDDGNPVKNPDGTIKTQKQLQFKINPDTKIDGTPITDDTDQKDIDAAVNRLASNVALVREKAVKAPGYDYYQGGVLISNNGDNNDPEGITAANISVSNAWSTHTVRLLNTTLKDEVDENGNATNHSTRHENISHMLSQFDLKRDYFAKDVRSEADSDLPIFHGSFREVFTAIGSTLGIDQMTTYSIADNYYQTALSLDNDRLSVSGVDLNEEATSMMTFSKSYAAACRLLTTIDSMLDTLINGTAR